MNNKIDIEGVIGWDVTSREVKRQIADLGDVDEIDVYINSPGGYIDDGFGTYVALKNAEAKVNIHVVGLAASMASVIAMAGDTVSIEETGMLMIHSPSSVVWGMAEDMRKEADVLDKYESRLIKAYKRRPLNISEEELQDAVSNETWYTADEAVEAGLVDSIDEQIEAREQTSASIEWLRMANFKNTPEKITDLYKKERAVSNIPLARANKLKSGSTAKTTEGKKVMTDEVMQSEADQIAKVKAAVEANDEKWVALLKHKNATNTDAVIEIAGLELNPEQSLKIMDLVEVKKEAKTKVIKAEDSADQSDKETKKDDLHERFKAFMEQSETNNINKTASHDGNGEGDVVKEKTAEEVLADLNKRELA